MNISITVLHSSYTKHRMLRCIFHFIVILIICCLPLHADTKLSWEMHELALSSINNVYREQFKQAENDAKRLIKKFPDHPAGYFFCAAVLNSYMEFLQSEKYEIDFYYYCDLAITKGEDLLEKDPNDTWAKFFLAGANGAKGTYESRYRRWITAFKHGWHGVVLLREVLESDPSMVDAIFGIATYDYWRSAKTKMLWWLPGVEDKREISIKSLAEIRQTGTYVKDGATLTLIDILCNEEKYQEAILLVNNFLGRYPTNLICWWGKVRAELGMKEYAVAEKSLLYIRELIRAASFESNYNEALYLYYLIKAYSGQEKYDLAGKELKTFKSLKLEPVEEKRFEEYLVEVLALEKKLIK